LLRGPQEHLEHEDVDVQQRHQRDEDVGDLGEHVGSWMWRAGEACHDGALLGGTKATTSPTRHPATARRMTGSGQPSVTADSITPPPRHTSPSYNTAD
jgi:hypothetical protein